MSRFQDQVVIVTGASRGIGRAIAEAFGREGARVACIATRRENALATAERIAGAIAYGCDVSNESSVQETFAQIESDLGVPQVLVNNAGITRDTLLMRMSLEDWDQVQAVNLRGAFLCSRAVTKSMMKARYGRMVNISSIVGQSGAAGQANYAASKAGVIGLTMALAKELGSRNITVNAVAPGFIETDMTSELSEEMRASVIAKAPIGRLGSGEDIAHGVTFLASREAGYITGQTLTIDGGLIL